MKVVVATGGFDPVHSGHIAYLTAARQLGDYLIVGVNSDAWLLRKKGYCFLPWSERSVIVQHIKGVDLVLPFDDSDGSACSLLETVKQEWPTARILVANGGDRGADNCLEDSVVGVELVFGVGGTTKQNSSSWIVDQVRNTEQ